MAITVEEERKPTNWVAIIGGTVVVIVIFVGAYFLFFKNPELIEVVVPNSLQSLNTLSKISFDPKSVLDPSSQEKAAKVFRSLRQYGTNVELPTPGRSNPFRSF